MKRIAFIVVALALAVVSGLGLFLYMRGQEQRAGNDIEALQRLDQDARITAVMDQLRASAGVGRIAIVNVSVVNPLVGVIAPAQTVIVDGETIEWVGPAAQAPALVGATVIDGGGRFLSPGLVDMHVHTEHMSQHVLRLAAGVTSVRDMDGFPWLLRTRDAIDSGAMIGAATYVAGTIIADQPLFGYAVVVDTPEAARQVVRNQAACGYSFIKIHNSLTEPLFDAVADEAHRLDLDLVGHVPHDITLRHAVQSGHMRTLEHLKGFLIDQTLLPSDEPYAPALEGAEVWIAPTLYARQDRAHGNEARQLAADPRQRYNPRARREEWLASVPAEGSEAAMLHDRLIETQAIIMARLLPLNPRWLVGTDAAGYMFNIAGFAVHDEMELLQESGLTPAQVVRAATSEPAVAMRRSGEFGTIAPGMRADLVLLGANPLEDVGAYRTNGGVMSRGRWYDRTALDAALEAIAAIYDEPLRDSVDLAALDNLASEAEARAVAGYIFEDSVLAGAAAAAERNGRTAAARTLRALMSAPASGVCAVNTPS